MNKYIDDILCSEFEVSPQLKLKYFDILVFITITLVAIIARISLFPYESNDYKVFLLPWFEQLKSAGGLNGFGLSIGDYTPPYIYIMTLLTKLPIDSLVSIKTVSIIFDFIGAIILMKLVYNQTSKPSTAIFAYATFLFAPTILLNSAMWAQCDIIFTAFLLLCVYYFTKERPFLATIFFGVAMAFKLQAIFLAPLLILLWLRNKMKFRHFLLIPGVYLISILPAFIMGRPFGELMTIYFSQAGQYESLSLNSPNLFTWVDSDSGAILSIAGIAVCFCVILLILYYSMTKKITITTKEIIAFALLFSLIVPFLLPHMHERYFYLADVLAILYAFTFKKRAIIPIAVILSSFASYTPYLFGITPIDLKLVAIVMLAVIYFIVKDIMNLVDKNKDILIDN